MTVTTTTAEIVLPGDGSNFTFNLGFEVATGDTLTVYLRDDTAKTRTLQVLNTDYTLASLGIDAGATITLLASTAIPSTKSIECARVTPNTQGTTLKTQGSFSPSALDERVDILTKLVQELKEKTDRAILIPAGLATPNPLNFSDSPSGKFVSLDASWNPTVGTPVATAITFSTFGTTWVNLASVSAGQLALSVEIGVDVQAFAEALDDVTGINTGDEVEATTSAAGTLKISSTAEYHSKAASRAIAPDVAYAAAAVVTLSDGANIAFDMDTGINFDITLAGNRTLDNPTNNDVGQSGFIEVNQDGTGTRTLDYDSEYVFPGGVAPVLTTTASHKDILFYTVLSATEILITLLSDFS